jgi:hypothetical protein
MITVSPASYDGQPQALGKPDREAVEQVSLQVKFRVIQAPFQDKIRTDLVVIRLQRFHDQ